MAGNIRVDGLRMEIDSNDYLSAFGPCSKYLTLAQVEFALKQYHEVRKKNMKWISVDDKLPEFDVGVLGFHDKFKRGTRLQTIRVVWLREGTEISSQFWESDVDSGLNITHWMLLPEYPV